MPDALHPDVVAVWPLLLGAPSSPADLSVEKIRAIDPVSEARLVGAPEPVFKTWDRVLQTEAGGIGARWYQPTETNPTLLLVYVHGGGWVKGSLDSHDVLCRALALRSGAFVLSIDYGLSPETAYPGALDQVCAVLANASQLAADEGFGTLRVAAAGDSAGGHLLATATHRLIEENQPLPESMVYLYPVTDASMRATSWTTFGSGYPLTYDRMKWFWEQYVGSDFARLQARARDPLLSPLYSDRLDRYPRSMVITARCDPLRDEGDAFADRLKEAAVQVEHVSVPGQVHGFLRMRQAFTDPEWGVDAVIHRIAAFLR
ncbi:alpha/beta hydrolase [Robbsia sp. KACC 23696]|uniref:alpha/beta hydrolase n=1 Tax=Robbsia sp. KACC 23696 TaxID=3149231 RepID=UPI00325AA563